MSSITNSSKKITLTNKSTTTNKNKAAVVNTPWLHGEGLVNGVLRLHWVQAGQYQVTQLQHSLLSLHRHVAIAVTTTTHPNQRKEEATAAHY